MRPNCRGHRVPCSRHALGISAVACGLSSSAVHRRLAPATSSSRELCASCRVLRPATCSPCLKKSCDLPIDRRAPPLGFRPSSRHQPAASTTRPGIPARTSFRPRRFSRPRRFAPPQASRVCFAPLPRPGFALQGFVPPRGSVPAFARPVHALLAVGPGPLSPRAFVPVFRAFFPARSAVSPGLVQAPRIRAPPGLHLPRAFPPRTLEAPSRPLRPSPSPRCTHRGWRPAFRRCADRLSWNQAPARSRFLA